MRNIYPHSIVTVEELEHYKKCKKSATTKCTVSTEKEPEVLTFDIKWFEVQALELLQFFNTIPNFLQLSDIFELQGQPDHHYILKGMVCYWNSHYYSFFRIQVGDKMQWLKFDDTKTTKYDDWHKIVKECVDSLASPAILFFEKVQHFDITIKHEATKSFTVTEREMERLLEEATGQKKKMVYDGENQALGIAKIESHDLDEP